MIFGFWRWYLARVESGGEKNGGGVKLKLQEFSGERDLGWEEYKN